jgi:hypothetical protein
VALDLPLQNIKQTCEANAFERSAEINTETIATARLTSTSGQERVTSRARIPGRAFTRPTDCAWHSCARAVVHTRIGLTRIELYFAQRARVAGHARARECVSSGP